MKKIIFLLLTMPSFSLAYEFEKIQPPKNWIRKQSTLPSVDYLFDVKIDKDNFSQLVYTSYSVPKISNLDEFKNYVLIQYKSKVAGYPKINIEEIQTCKNKKEYCYSAIVNHRSKYSNEIILLNYFRVNNKDYIGSISIKKNSDTHISSKRVLREMENAIR